jgi:hypothetical protein
MAQSGRRLIARPMESEQPEAEINYYWRATMYTKTAFIFHKYTQMLEESSSVRKKYPLL